MTQPPEALVAEVEQRLRRAFEPTHLQIKDESHLHVGHPGADGRHHLRIRIASPRLRGTSRLDAHRRVYAALEDLMHTHIHALALQVLE